MVKYNRIIWSVCVCTRGPVRVTKEDLPNGEGYTLECECGHVQKILHTEVARLATTRYHARRTKGDPLGRID